MSDRRNGLLEDFQVVVRVLQRPIWHQTNIGAWKALIDHAVHVGVDRSSDLPAVGNVDEHSTTRFTAQVHANYIFTATRNNSF